MKTLVIHPKDKSTDFLKPIYEKIDAEIVTGGVTQEELYKKVVEHDRIIMLGHGSPQGLFAVSQFDGLGYSDFIINDGFAKVLSQKNSNLYIWCHADQFVNKHNLSGFYTGMFISEEIEALMYDIYPAEKDVEISNRQFSNLVAEMIQHPPRLVLDFLLENYSLPRNKVCEFNRTRLYSR